MAKQIKKIEFVNLCTFKGKHEIFFDKGINVITGGNGSGKSSIIEGINAVIGNDIDNIEKLISHDKKYTSLKLVFDDETCVKLILLKECDKNIKKMYFINNSYKKNNVTEITNDINTIIEDNVGTTFDLYKLKNLANEIKNNNKQQILVSLQKTIIDIADKVINTEDLKQCKIV